MLRNLCMAVKSLLNMSLKEMGPIYNQVNYVQKSSYQ